MSFTDQRQRVAIAKELAHSLQILAGFEGPLGPNGKTVLRLAANALIEMDAVLRMQGRMLSTAGDRLATEPVGPPRDAMTARQRWYLAAIVDLSYKNHGMGVTLREIGARMRLTSTNGVAGVVRSLLRRGWVEQLPGSVARSLRATLPLPEPFDELADLQAGVDPPPVDPDRLVAARAGGERTRRELQRRREGRAAS